MNTWRTDEKISFPMSSNYSAGFLLPAFLPTHISVLHKLWKRLDVAIGSTPFPLRCEETRCVTEDVFCDWDTHTHTRLTGFLLMNRHTDALQPFRLQLLHLICIDFCSRNLISTKSTDVSVVVFNPVLEHTVQSSHFICQETPVGAH